MERLEIKVTADVKHIPRDKQKAEAFAELASQMLGQLVEHFCDTRDGSTVEVRVKGFANSDERDASPTGYNPHELN